MVLALLTTYTDGRILFLLWRNCERVRARDVVGESRDKFASLVAQNSSLTSRQYKTFQFGDIVVCYKDTFTTILRADLA